MGCRVMRAGMGDNLLPVLLQQCECAPGFQLSDVKHCVKEGTYKSANGLCEEGAYAAYNGSSYAAYNDCILCPENEHAGRFLPFDEYAQCLDFWGQGSTRLAVPIAGGIAGGCVLLLLAVALCVFYNRRRRRGLAWPGAAGADAAPLGDVELAREVGSYEMPGTLAPLNQTLAPLDYSTKLPLPGPM